MKKKILLIGWDAADWKAITPLMDAGKMPNLQNLVERGTIGNISTLYPPLSPMLWTSIATGKRPYKHGIYGFSEPTPDGQGIRPVSNLSRKTRALWNIFHTQGMKSNVIGWWPSHPAEPINGVMISNMYQRHVGQLNKDEGPDARARHIGGNEILEKIEKNWPLPPQCVHPASLEEPLSKLRVHPQELTADAILPFLPKLAEIDQEKDHRPETVAKMLCECTSVHAAATATMQLEPWDFMAVYYDAIDHFSHGFMQYHPPRLPWVGEQDFEHYQHVIEVAYRYHDMMLGTLLELAGKDTTIMLISDHGFHPDHNRPRQVANEPAGPAEEHSHYGIFVMAGPGIKQDERIYGANLLDVAPTILHAFDLPVGENMDGKVLINVFDSDRPIETIPSWDAVDGEDGSHPGESVQDPLAAKAALDQLVELGYIEKLDDNIEKTVEKTARELEYNLARSYEDAGMYAHAAEILEKLRERFPTETRFGIQLVNCRLQLKQLDGIDAELKALERQKTENVRMARQKIDDKFGQYKSEDGQWNLSEAPDEARKELRNLLIDARTNPYALNVLRASLYVAQERHLEAKEEFEAAIKQGAGNLVIQEAADNLVNLGEDGEALALTQRALQLDPSNARAYLTQAKVHFKRNELGLAEDRAVQSIGLLYHNPEAHLWLARICRKQGKIPRAVESLEIALAQAPQFVAALLDLIDIYERDIKNPAERGRLQKALGEAESVVQSMQKGTFDTRTPASDAPIAMASDSTGKTDNRFAQTVELDDSIVIVSGLPRSGTSMLMQMLDAADYPVFSDHNRKADSSNPKGYFEYRGTAALRRRNNWMPEVVGQAIKIVSPLLPTIPLENGFHYRVLFMERDLEEILQSQEKMIQSKKGDGASRDHEVLLSNYKHQLARVKRMLHARRIPVLYIDYRKCINEPEQTAREISQFLDGKLDETKMATAVDPTLYRIRAAT